MGGWQRGRGRGMPVKVRAELLGRLRSGATWAQVQLEFKCSHQLVWRIVRDAGGCLRCGRLGR